MLHGIMYSNEWSHIYCLFGWSCYIQLPCSNAKDMKQEQADTSELTIKDEAKDFCMCFGFD